MSGTVDPTHVYWDLENRKGIWARGEAMSKPTDQPIWAQDKAREFIERQEVMTSRAEEEASLAALLVEVAAVGQMVRAEDAEYLSTLRADVLAEVRRVVEEVRGSRIEGHCFKCVRRAGDEILARLEKL